MDISKYGSHATSFLIYLLDHQDVPITTFTRGFHVSPPTAYRTLSKLEADNLIVRKEILKKRRLVKISLTDKGREVAQALRVLETVDESKNSNPPLSIHVNNEIKKIKELRLLYHINVLDDHVTIEEIPQGSGRPRIFNVYIKRNGHGDFMLWCERDESFECVHAQVAWTYPQVQHMVVHYKGKTKICRVCGYENPDDHLYCGHCGAKLD